MYAYWDEELAEDYEEDSSWQDFPLVLKVVPPEFAYMREEETRPVARTRLCLAAPYP